MTIDGRQVTFTDEPNVLSVIRKANIDIPTLCYMKDLPIYGACRLCTVEDGRGRTFSSCSETPRDGMEIYTSTPKLMRYRKMILELLLASHCRDCTTCDKSGSCRLQELCNRLGVNRVRFENTKEQYELDTSSPSIIRDPNKCVLCGNCVRVCENIQGVNAIDFAYRGTDAMVTPAFNKKLAETDCVNCGQCRVVCPTGAITIHSNIDDVWDALADKDTKVICQVAPAVRVGLGDAFGLPTGSNVFGQMVTALHQLGFDQVYDTTYGADLTVIEEAKEAVERLNKNENLPIFTSCCPAWVKFCQTRYPDLAGHLSTCRSPQQMFGAVLKEYFKDETKNEGKKVVSVTIMPCTAKKDEIRRPTSWTNGEQDIDYALTTTEVAAMIRRAGIKFETLEESKADDPFELGSGGGVIFGVTGGVTEAVLRWIGGGTDGTISTCGVRGEEGMKEFTYKHGDLTLRGAVVSGLANAARLMDRIRAGEVDYQIVEVMACPRGCVMGGGQPVMGVDTAPQTDRINGLYNTDISYEIKASQDNPAVQALYEGLLKGREHELLHCPKVEK